MDITYNIDWDYYTNKCVCISYKYQSSRVTMNLMLNELENFVLDIGTRSINAMLKIEKIFHRNLEQFTLAIYYQWWKLWLLFQNFRECMEFSAPDCKTCNMVKTIFFLSLLLLLLLLLFTPCRKVKRRKYFPTTTRAKCSEDYFF